MNRAFSSLAIATVVLLSSCVCNSVDTFCEAKDPVALSEEAQLAWKNMESKVCVAWGSPDYAYSRSEVPQITTDRCRVVGWQGEKLSAQLLLWTTKPLKGVSCKISNFKSKDGVLSSSIAQARFVRYTLADKVDMACRCDRPNGHPAILQADMLDNIESLDIEGENLRPIWITVAIPHDAKPGLYDAVVKLSYGVFGSKTLPLELEVVGQELARPSEWNYHLDLWQHPSAVARVERVEVWSDRHFEAMRPIMQMLADAGQKVITATLNRDPWRYQCFDDYEPMITWRRYDNDVWRYDYTIFDKWVEYAMSFGIDKQINCYSMLPWGDCLLDYQDMRSTAKSNRNVKVKAIPGTPEFEAMWGPFLKDFAQHLREKGWLHITNMAIDERAPKDIDEAARVLNKYAPELGFAMADNHDSYKRYANMRDVCVGQKHSLMAPEEIANRRANGYVSTYYMCCSTLFPNVFTNSQPYEAEMLGLYTIAHDYDGMLRWAYNSWPANPEYDSRFRYWASGDTYLVYPGARSSVRFERLIDGIELYEKIRTLRLRYAGSEELNAIEELLAEVRSLNINDSSFDWASMLAKVNSEVNRVAKELSK